MNPNADSPQEHLAALQWTALLARALARGADADDVVQETWTRATREFGPGSVPPRRWLAGTIRSIAFRMRRGEARRREREAARETFGSAAPPASELVERVEIQRAVAREVLDLPEEDRELILLRFQEGFGLAEIARRLGVPRSTAGDRLERALGALRARFRTRQGRDWRRALLVAVPFRTPRATPIAIMSKKLTVVGSTALLILAATAVVLLVEHAPPDGRGGDAVARADVDATPSVLPATAQVDDASPVRTRAIASDGNAVAGVAVPDSEPQEPWSVRAVVDTYGGEQREGSLGYVAFMRPTPTVVALDERPADGVRVGPESLDVCVVEESRTRWRLTPSDPRRGSIVVACVLGDHLLESRIADARTDEIRFRINMDDVARFATGSVRFRVMSSRENDDGSVTGKTASYGIAAGRVQQAGAKAVMPLAEGEWTVVERLPLCPLQLTVRGPNWIEVTRPFEPQPDEIVDLGTIYTDEPWDFVFFRLVRPDGSTLHAEGHAIDRRTGSTLEGFQEWSAVGGYVTVTRAEHDLALRVEAPGWSEVPIPVARDRITPGHPRDVQDLPALEIPVERANAVTWSLPVGAPRESDYVVLRTDSGYPIRVFAASDVEHVVSFLPPARYLWTIHRGTGVELARATADVGSDRGPIVPRLESSQR